MSTPISRNSEVKPFMSINTAQATARSKLDHEYYMSDIKKAITEEEPENYFHKLANEHFKQVHQTFAAFKGDPLINNDEINSRKVYLPTTSKNSFSLTHIRLKFQNFRIIF